MNRARITVSAFLAYFCVSGVLSTIGIVSGPMADYFGVTVTEITRGFGWLTIGMLVGAGLAIEVVERLSIRLIQICTFGVIALSLAALSVAPSLLLVWPLLGLTGLSLGIGLAAAASTIARSYPPSPRASMLVITDACFSLAGKVCVAATLYFLGEKLHWSTGYLVVVAAATSVVLLAGVSRYPETDADLSGELGTNDEAGRTSGWPVDIWLCIAALCLYTLGQYAMLWWLPQHLQSTYGASPDEAGAVVGQFWLGMLWAQLVVAWWVLKTGAPRLVLIAAISAALCSVPLWNTANLELIPWLGALWGFGNLAFLKLAISFATELQTPPSPRLVSALLFGATSGTAISPWVTSKIVESAGTLAVLQFSSGCYVLICLLIGLVLWRNRDLLTSRPLGIGDQNLR